MTKKKRNCIRLPLLLCGLTSQHKIYNVQQQKSCVPNHPVILWIVEKKSEIVWLIIYYYKTF